MRISRAVAAFTFSLLCLHCGGGVTKLAQKPDVRLSTVSVSPATGVFADGQAFATITVSLVDSLDAPVVGHQVHLSASGAGDTVVQPASTDRTGTAIGTLASTSVGTQTITATVDGVTLEQHPTVQFIAGPARALAFTVQPSNTAAGAAIAPAVQVSFEDAEGRLVALSQAVTLSLGPGSAAGPLSGTLTQPAVNGVASFPDLKLDLAGSYTLVASTSGLTSTTSQPFLVGAGTPSALVFRVEPSTTRAGDALVPPVEVALEDAEGNVIPDSATSVTLAIGTNGGTSQPGTLSGTLTRTVLNGVATFADLSLDQAGTGYTLTATAGDLPKATSSPFDVLATSTSKMVFTVQPSDSVAGGSISPAVAVTLLDSFGNVATSDSSTVVTLALGANPSSATLTGTLTTTVHNGVATFSDLSLQRAGTSYTLTAAATGLTGATSHPFNVVAGPAAGAVFAVQPSDAIAGAPIAPAVSVALQDSFGNLIVADSSTIVTISLGANPGSGTLSGTTTVTATGGVATFPDLKIDRAANGYTLTATANGYSSATSAPFDVHAGTGSKLVFSAQPSNTTAGTAIAPAIAVTLQDTLGNTITSDSSTVVTVALGANPGSSTLFGTTTGTVSNGIATFLDLSLNRAGQGYTLTATAPGYAQATSSAFDVAAGAPAQAVFTTQPSNASAGASLTPAVVITLEDAFGNTITTDSSTSISLALASNPTGGTLSGTTTMTAMGGMATFTDLNIHQAGIGYTLSATASGYAGATSNTFDIVAGQAGAPSTLTANPSTVVADGQSVTTLTLTLLDAYSNVISGQPVSLSATGSNNTFTPATGTTGADGRFVATLASTTAEDKVITATAGTFSFTAPVTFIPPATCTDHLQNSNETGVDCGGHCGATCALGIGCASDGDCVSGYCDTTTNKCSREFQVNTTTAGDQRTPVVAVLSDQSYVIAWEQGTNTVVARHFGPNGAPVADNFTVDTTSDSTQSMAITPLTGGGYALAWTYWGQSYWGYGPYGRIYSSTDTAAGNAFLVGQQNFAYAYSLDIANFGGTGFAVAWNDFSNGAQPYARAFDSTGAAQTGIESNIADTSHSYNQYGGISLTELNDGRLVEAYGAGGTTVVGRVLDSSGAPVGSSMTISSATVSSGVNVITRATPSGGFLAAWDRSDGSGHGIGAQLFDSTLAAVGTEIDPNTTTANDQSAASIAVNQVTGKFAIAWTSSPAYDGSGNPVAGTAQDGSGQAAVLRLYNADGTPATDEIVVNNFTDGNQSSPRIASFTDGSWIVVWTSAPLSSPATMSQDGAGAGVFAQRFDSTGARIH